MTKKSISAKRADHRHDYEHVIIQEGLPDSPDPLKSFFWGKRCKICGRVDDSDWFKAGARDGLIMKTLRVRGCDIPIYFTAEQLREKYPHAPLLIRKAGGGGYEEL